MTNKSRLCILSIALLGSTSAYAADLPSIGRAEPMAPLAYNWTGFYIGAQTGYVWGKDKTTEYLTANGAFTGLAFKYDTNGAVGGIHAGVNYQMSSVVVGVEADLEAVAARGSFYNAPDLLNLNPGGIGNIRLNSQGSLRGRLGYAFDRILVYGTAGLAVANIKYTFTNPTSGRVESTASQHTGFTFGGGVDYAITDNLIASIDYRHSDFGKFRYTSTFAFIGLTGSQHPRSDTLRAGLSYKF